MDRYTFRDVDGKPYLFNVLPIEHLAGPTAWAEMSGVVFIIAKKEGEALTPLYLQYTRNKLGVSFREYRAAEFQALYANTHVAIFKCGDDQQGHEVEGALQAAFWPR